MENIKAARKAVKKDIRSIGWCMVICWLFLWMAPLGLEHLSTYLGVAVDPMLGLFVPLAGGLALVIGLSKKVDEKQFLQGKEAMKGADFGLLLCAAVSMLGAALLVCTAIAVELRDNGYQKDFGLSASLADMQNIDSMMMVWIVIPLFEEFLLRGFVVSCLKPRSKIMAIIVSAILVGLTQTNFFAMVIAIALGLVYGYVTVEYSPIWSCILHATVNAVGLSLIPTLLGSCGQDANRVVTALLAIICTTVLGLQIAKRKDEVKKWFVENGVDKRTMKWAMSTTVMILFMVASIGLSAWFTFMA